MKKLIKYQCEVCEHLFETEEMATACENKGIEEDFAKEKEFVRVRMGRGILRAGKVVSIETKGHEKHYTIGVFPETNGLHYTHQDTITLKGFEEVTSILTNWHNVEETN